MLAQLADQKSLCLLAPPDDDEDSRAIDINRTFPKHVLYRDKQGLGQQQLLNVLRAYSIFNAEVGYCSQGMGFICGVLLMYMGEDDEKKEKKDDKDEKDEKKEADKAKDAKKDRRDVVVHPIVLLGVVDHYNRVAKGTTKRVVGTLLGEVTDLSLHITNCFAVPFEEDPRDPQVWFLDHNYHEQMFAMFKKVNTKERIVGWYSTGPKIKPSDLSIHELYRRYCPEPVLVVMDVQPKAK
eukprot:Skav212367  [mRNA]  locus=scaffold3038:200859:209956:+ [translate_table: standard]